MAMAVADEFDAEEPVIEAIRGGDRYAFEEFVRRRNRWVRGVIFGVLGNRECVDDVSQQVWSAVWQRIGELRDSRSWRPWLYRLGRPAPLAAGPDATRRRTLVQPLAANPPERTAAPAPDEAVA